jgi:cytochrome c-type protein NapB
MTGERDPASRTLLGLGAARTDPKMAPGRRRLVRRSAWRFVTVAGCLALSGCGGDRWDPVPGHPEAVKSKAEVRAGRRLYDGAPPVIPHGPFGAACSACHDMEGIAVEGIGYAPASPHVGTPEEASTQRCRQCHVFAETDRAFVKSSFAGVPQDLAPGERLYDGAPPTIPHRTFMRETCLACHSGPGAREGIVTSHPERTRCRQCHVPFASRGEASH